MKLNRIRLSESVGLISTPMISLHLYNEEMIHLIYY